MDHHDLFISYHTPDREAISTVREFLKTRGVSSFLDREQLVAGLPWPQALEEALKDVRAVAVFLGPTGLGLWQKREMWFALDRQAQEEKASDAFPVIPVLLPGADPAPGFLFLNTWVNLRDDLSDPEALESLVCAVLGESVAPAEEIYSELRPYRGLEIFKEEHSAFFCGREVFTERLLEKVLQQSLVAVMGPSGSGKSSVVQAGLVPALRRQRPPDKTWDVAVFTPSDRPYHRLATALIAFLYPELNDEIDLLAKGEKLGNRLAQGEVKLEATIDRLLEKSDGTDRLLLVVDQFEELFTNTADKDRQPFVNLLLNARTRCPLTLVLTLRADFYENAINVDRDLSDAMEQGIINLGSMKVEEIKRAIEEAATRVGLSFEEGLVDRILGDVAKEPGYLPLLEFALTQLWRDRNDRKMTHKAYAEFGGLFGAITDRADQVLDRLQKAERLAARRALLALVNPGEDAPDTSRQARLSAMNDDERAVVQVLADERLVVTGRDEVTGVEVARVAHEVLIRKWEKLKQWVDERRDDLRLIQQVRVQAEEWRESGGDEKYQRSHEWVRDVADALKRLGEDVRLGEVEKEFLGPIDPEALFMALNDEATDHQRRALIGERLAVLGDTRAGIGLTEDKLPDIEWCEVSRGEVILEIERRVLGGTKKRRREVEPFRIAKYPVTYSQYRAFLEAEDGYRDPRWWDDLYHEDELGRQSMRYGNHPADYVSWFDAMAFCRWLTYHYRERGEPEEDTQIRLPTEWEWQLAATGGDTARLYPWGREPWDAKREHWRANSYESYLGHTTAVGMYPAGISPVGALDMGGNVWEWCLNKYDDLDKTASRSDDFGRRVIRGGSWLNYPVYLRSAARYRYFPGDRGTEIGFRLAQD